MLCAPFLLSSCATKIQTPGTEVGGGHASFCAVAKKITFSRLSDSLPTIEQVKEHNAVGRTLGCWQ